MDTGVSSSANNPVLNKNSNIDWPLKNTPQFQKLIYPENRPREPEQTTNAFKSLTENHAHVKLGNEAVEKTDNGALISPGIQATQQVASSSKLNKTTEHARPRFPVLDLSQNISEPDSLIDLYKYRRPIQQTPITPDFPRTPITPDSIMATTKRPIEVEDQEAKWIHRDKLTQIEIQEYIDRGMKPPAELLTRAAQRRESRTSRQARHPDMNTNDNKKLRLNSPDPHASPFQGYDEDEEPFIPEDPRSPEEIAEDSYADGGSHIMGKLRASSSKIPLATSSPLPVPVEHLERDTPLRRKRETSNEWDGEYTPQLRMRSRGDSDGSQVFLDDDGFSDSSPPQTSPLPYKNSPKIRTPSGASKIVNGKTRTESGNARVTPNQRPRTRSGTGDKPRITSSKPEGDPPWIDQMYKPDPMLPPDQQMLPTHAKRMMAEKWEKEAKSGSIYDRELTPVTIHDETKMKPYAESEDPYQELNEHSERQDHYQERESSFEPSNDKQWPLKPSNAVNAPKSPNPDHGGYSTMPKLPKQPSNGPPTSPRRPEQQLQVDNEKQDKEKGGCGCCVVM